ncbi:hypothetical protein AX769_11395 [Frondihabitans sp. PAMC 28766]|uniref:DUF4234 domain-containing protein n=1 Tax=Frondihabitans sp. PAMC 28766 TaxID=1795630 RepID=UPI00078DC9BC|nr:DUF4234 domain-containing protein [Frondihabitans sp. PAMC 28766]AMM20636.1 hypothetical protein AX769_11395 [Frondihabitans sp. PAMC 28766]
MTIDLQLQQRSAVAVFFLPIITFGIYSIVWLAKTRGEVNRSGAHAMTTWWILCPFGFFWYFWSLAKGIDAVTGLGTGGDYALLLLLGQLGQAIVQARINARVSVPTYAPPVPFAA